MHHPPFITGIAHMDAIGLLAGTAELEQIVAAHPNVERIICGHLHRTIFRRFGGTLASTCPGPAHQVALDLRRSEERSVGQECVTPCRSRWSPSTLKKNQSTATI